MMTTVRVEGMQMMIAIDSIKELNKRKTKTRQTLE